MASIPTDSASLHALTLATQTMTDSDLINFCDTNEGTQRYCDGTPAIADRLLDSVSAQRTGRSPSTAASIRSLLASGTGIQLEEKLGSLDDAGFLEAAATNTRAIDIIAGNPYLSIRLNKLDSSLASSVGVTVPESDGSALASLSSGARSNSAGRRSNGSSASSRARSTYTPEVNRDEDGNIILSGDPVEDAQILANVSQAELDEYDDEYVLGVLSSPQYRSITPRRSPGSGRSSMSRTSPASPPRASPASPSRTSPARSVPLSPRSASPSRRPFTSSPGRNSPPASTQRNSPPASPRSLASRARSTSNGSSYASSVGSVYTAPLTYNKAEDARTLASYPKSQVLDRAATDNYVASVVRSPEYHKASMSTNGHKDEFLQGTCTVSCRRA
ncbi:Hypothetical protein POVR2_LOCUS392 [uncultured virus]|nr:Hypothetical protein POVR2_LOCUS392 [uncultured virus]